jgi:voltage-gated potassium channel
MSSHIFGKKMEKEFFMIKRLWSETLTILALAFLVAFSWPAFVAEIDPQTQRTLDYVQWISWFAFAIDLLFGLIAADKKIKFLIHHPLEVITVLLPFLRPLRLLRVISFGTLVIQKVAVGRQFAITLKVFLASILLAYIGAVQITISERGVEGSNIKNFGDGLWWAITTVTTVGYGDRFPVTSTGRVLAVCLMLVGISLMGVITASVAAWFVKMSQDDSTPPKP